MNIKKIINYLVVLLVLFSFIAPATRAEEARNTIRQRVEEERENIAEKFTAQKEQFRQRIEETRKIRIRAYWGRIMGRMGIATTRLERIADRISSRLDKFQEKGVDVTNPRELLETAKTKITDAKAAVENAKNKIEEIMNSGGDAKTIFQQIKDELNKVKQAIKDAHSALVDVIVALKPGLIK